MQEAQKAAEEGNYPFGAVITDNTGNVLATAHNTQNTDVDPTAHAEINLIRNLAKTHSEAEFNTYYLVSNAESCSMCMSAAIKAGIRHFIFGAPSEAHMVPYLTVTEITKYCKCDLDITLGVLEKECKYLIAQVREVQNDYAQ